MTWVGGWGWGGGGVTVRDPGVVVFSAVVVVVSA